MDEAVAQLARQLLDSGLAGLGDRERRVILRIATRMHAAPDVNRVLDAKQTFGERLADRVAQLGGSWTFILIFSGFLAAWIIGNTVLMTDLGTTVDPYPYIFLNLILSMVAALQAPVILMSQNRQAARDRMAAALDYEVNLRAETEIVGLHDKLDQIRLDRLEAMIGDLGRQLAEVRSPAGGHPTPDGKRANA